MAKTKTIPAPLLREIATSASDPWSGYIGNMLVPEDEILIGRNGGDLRLYGELLRDDQVFSTFQQRRLAVTSKETVVDPGGTSAIDKKAADALRENLEALAWDDIFDKMLFGRFYGYSVAEIMWKYDGGLLAFDDIKVRKPWRFKFAIDGGIHLLSKQNQIDGDRMPDRKFWTFSSGSAYSDSPYGLGLGHYLYWPVFFKKSDIKFWLIFLEKFGTPTAAGKLPPAMFDNSTERAKVLAALRAISTDSAVALPEGVTIELIEAARSGAADYAGLHRVMNAAISKINLSQTMTTDDGSSRSQSEVHMEVRDEVVKADADLVSESFIRNPVKWWTEYNFPGAKPPRVWRKTEDDEDLDTIAARDKTLFDQGWKRTPESFAEVYGKGFVEKAEANPFLGGGKPGGPEIPAEFAETVGKILTQKIQNRKDQQDFVDAARTFASNYEAILGPRVSQLIAALEESGDLLTFRERLNELLAEGPDPTVVQKLQRGGVVSRLMGAMRGR